MPVAEAKRSELPFLSVAYGGGGSFGTAYNLGVARALMEAGLRLGEAPAIGTSAGSWAAACVASGVGFERVAELPPLRLPDLRPGLLRGFGRSIFGDLRCARVRVSVIGLHDLRRRMLSGADHALADLVAASSAVPGLLSPVGLGGRVYFDGGLRSVVSADVADAARHLLVIAPISAAVMGRAGLLAQRTLVAEVRRWERATGGAAHIIQPDAKIASLVRRPADLFDREVLRETYPLARAHGARLIRSRPDLLSLLDGGYASPAAA